MHLTLINPGTRRTGIYDSHHLIHFHVNPKKPFTLERRHTMVHIRNTLKSTILRHVARRPTKPSTGTRLSGLVGCIAGDVPFRVRCMFRISSQLDSDYEISLLTTFTIW